MLQVQEVYFGYEDTPVLDSVSFNVAPGEYLAVMGESGCGKSTLLRLIYGELPFEQGTVQWKDHPIKGPAYQLLPGAPFMKYLSQDFDLMPFLSVEDNIRKYLSLNEPEASDRRTEELLELMDLDAYRSRQVRYLSGGEQQRVALARVLAQKPELLLLDEPFSHMDHFRKNPLRQDLFSWLRREGISCICASHDYNDVLPYADRVLVLQQGKVLDLRPTTEMYTQPKRLYTAALLGDANLIPVQVLKSYATTTRRIIVYAHELKLSAKSGFEAQVEASFFLGSHFRLVGRLEGGAQVTFYHDANLEKGRKIFLNVSLETINKRLPI
ncbi:ABC transporter ATP-binding protein [Robiginitalea sp. M366]|uniref:ABC transporter ATP-binding protein n=1 Tax=Robiginitalea aestuariiviva TaxID=3036903 RepID=UPI00240CF31B|nr:ABC transporter ATP-binding protein [Robiginitalea aestuariiviva]MDG1571578.1 ABC transporter ATP-binding protein [Robiginitalea aestuariiviva]